MKVKRSVSLEEMALPRDFSQGCVKLTLFCFVRNPEGFFSIPIKTCLRTQERLVAYVAVCGAD